MTKTNTATILNRLYENDENLWFFENAKLIRMGKIGDVDWTNIAQELENMGKSQKICCRRNRIEN